MQESTLGLLPNPFEKQGVKFAVTYIGEDLGNPSGGVKQSAIYEDRINFAVDADFEKLIGLKQVTFHANVFQIDSGGLSRGALLNFMDVSGIEALPTTRLYEAWFEKKWGEKIALRAGQIAADTEFMTSKYADVFTNASLGWPAACRSICRAIFRFWQPCSTATQPARAPTIHSSGIGVDFRVNDPPLVLSEVQFQWNAKKGDPGWTASSSSGGASLRQLRRSARRCGRALPCGPCQLWDGCESIRRLRSLCRLRTEALPYWSR
ncbi:hypothetical protein ABIF69_004440 [Bradyrhizobium japonicum]